MIDTRISIPAVIFRCTGFSGEYMLGGFTELDCGFDFYAPQSFEDRGRRLMIGWMGMPDAEYQNPTVESGWQHCLTVPCEISRDGTRLLRYPVPELEKLRQERVAPENAKVFDLNTARRARESLSFGRALW